MRRHGITEAVLADHQPLISESAQNSSQPLNVRESEEHRGDQERPAPEFVEREALEIRPNKVAIKERPIENLLERWNNKRRTQNSSHGNEPGQSVMGRKRGERVPGRLSLR